MKKTFLILLITVQQLLSQTINISTVGHGAQYDYNSIQAWYEDRQGNLVADNRREIAKIAKGEYNENVRIDSSTTSSTCYFHLMPDDTSWHNGTRGSGVVIKGDGTNKYMMVVRDDYTIVEGLELTSTFQDPEIIPQAIAIGRSSSYVKHALIDRCLIYGIGSDGYGFSSYDSDSCEIRNSFIFDIESSGIYYKTPGGVLFVTNTTIFDISHLTAPAYGGIYVANGSVTCVNTMVVNCERNCYKAVADGSFTNCEYNIADDATTPGTNITNNWDWNNKFISSTHGSENLHLRGYVLPWGKDLSSTFTYDIDGDTRNNWVIGADDGYEIIRRKDILFCIEERDWADVNGDGKTGEGWTHFFTYPDFTYYKYNGTDSIYFHCDNGGYNDSGQSYLIGTKQYQINCTYKASNPINLFVRDFHSQELLDSLIIYSDQDNERLTLLGISRLPGSDTLLLGGYERYQYGGADADDNYGIYAYKYPETKAYLKFRTRCINGLDVVDSLLYCASEFNDSLQIININNWTEYDYKDLNHTPNRGCTTVSGDTVVAVCDEDANLVKFYSRNSPYTFLWSFDFSPYLHHSSNPLYGSWFIYLTTKGRKSPIITRK